MTAFSNIGFSQLAHADRAVEFFYDIVDIDLDFIDELLEFFLPRFLKIVNLVVRYFLILSQNT